MTDSKNDSQLKDVMDGIRGARDAISVRRVFGDPMELNGVTVIPVARVAGGGGGGGGEGSIKDEQTGTGFGTGFGLHAGPVGVYEVRDGQVVWKPAVDATRLAKGGQLLAGLLALCITVVMLRRSR
jgi:uncharacterized spore protein YtfJ